MADLTTNKSYNYYWQSAKFKDLVFSGSLISQFVNDKGYITSSVAISASYALTASYVKNAISASYFSGSVSNAISASYALTASYVRNAVSASYAATSSYSLNPTVSGSINNVNYIDFNTGSAVPSWKSGRIFWDNTEGCLAVYNAEADITLQVGQENWTRVYNDTGVTIANGAAVRIIGTHGDHPEVVLAQSIQVSGSANLVNQILGVATHAIEDNSFGYITTQGLVRGLNTNAFNDGDTLYVSSSAGQLTNIVLPAPYEIIPVAQVVKASPGASGIIYVAVQQPVDFADLSSVYISGSYSGGDIWTYNAPNKRWEHTNQLSGSYGLTGSLTATSFTGSLRGTATTASSVTNLNQSVTIGKITSTPSTENTLNVYPSPAGGTGEGGQILLAASEGLYTSASMLDTYQNQFRLLKGTNTGGSTVAYIITDLQSGNTQFAGAVTASAYSGLPNAWMHGLRSGNQTIGSGTWANRDIIFNDVSSNNFTYNSSTGIATLRAGKTYRITSRLAWAAAGVYVLQFRIYNQTTSAFVGPTAEIIQSTNGTNNISDGTLEHIFAVGASDVDISIRTTNITNALTGEYIRGDLNTQLIIQQIS
jgi:predicted RecA/RadA family phage recombinase